MRNVGRFARTYHPVQSELIELKVKLLSENAILPTRGSNGSAGLDIYAAESVTVMHGDIRMIHTGVAMEIPEGHFGLLVVRSSLGKNGVRMATGASIIDSDYRGEVMVCLCNDGIYPRKIEKGERIAQIILQPYLKAEPAQVEELSKSDRGSGGFGSTGTA